MTGILKKDGSYPLAVNGWTDHVHAFFELQPKTAISDQMRMLKATSSKWINDNSFLKGRFQWQEGFGAFSYSKSQRDTIIRYIADQERHHKKISFKEEYLDLLKAFDIAFETNTSLNSTIEWIRFLSAPFTRASAQSRDSSWKPSAFHSRQSGK